MRDPPYGRLLPHGSKCKCWNEWKHCNAIAMIIASRSLKITTSEISDGVINIHAPEPVRVDWLCRYDIGWPEGNVERPELMPWRDDACAENDRNRDHHRSGRLGWLAPGWGYGSRTIFETCW